LKKYIFGLATIVLIFSMQTVSPAYADHEHGPTITDAQISEVFRHMQFSWPLTPDPIKLRSVGIRNGQFRLYVETEQPAGRLRTVYQLWLKPDVSNGKIICTTTQLWIDTKVVKPPSAEFAGIEPNSYCNMFLSPFLVGYGQAAVVETIKLETGTIRIGLSGTLAPHPTHPITVGRCHAYFPDGINIRSGPGLEYSIIQKDHGEPASVLDWNDKWVNIEVNNTIGWVWKYFLIDLTVSCQPDYRNTIPAWLRSDAP
jgi:hypothetical protein